MPTSWAITDPRDVYAINSLYAALNFPLLAGWIPIGGDPCGLGWQGVQCVNANITGIILNGANLGGQLGGDLGFFASIIQIDLSNNHIGGPIPLNLPLTIRSLLLSGNQFTGNVPSTISSLSQLTDLSLNGNHLTGVIPDSFQQLKSLTNMDFSGNILSGPLPSSMESLSSLTLLHLENNQLIGTLDVLENLPLIDLNVENNLFSGPIPGRLMTLPNFRKDGNPFNTTVLPSPPLFSPSPSPSPTAIPPPVLVPENQTTGPSSIQFPHARRESNDKTSNNVTWIVVAGLLTVVVLILVTCLFLSRCWKRRLLDGKTEKRHEIYAYGNPKANSKKDDSFQKPDHQAEKEEAFSRPQLGNVKDKGRDNVAISSDIKQLKDCKTKNQLPEQQDHNIDMSGFDSGVLPQAPPSPPFSLLSSESSMPDPILASLAPRGHALERMNTVKLFNVASLQQYTDSFSQENVIGKGMLGTVYKAELPDGKLLAVKKLDAVSTRHQSDQEFLELVSNLSKLQHANIVKLVGYCMEHRQRLLIYDYCKNGTLHEALHFDHEIHRGLSWKTRVRMALQAAEALEYLHEVCQPRIVHKNFKSANILLDDELAIRISDSGLAPLLSSNSMTQLQGCGYGAPELESGSYNCQSDVYSFGVVMLELLTGRKSYDRSRPRGEQFLVRWAMPQLHDIDAISRMVDPLLRGPYSSKSLSRFADIISLCIQPEPEFRPPMSEIVQNLLHMVQRDL